MALEMQNDPNILYGGDVDDLGPIDGGFGSLGALLIADLKTGGERTVFINGTNHMTWKYSDILREAIKNTKTFSALGLKQNEVISIVSENRMEFISISFAAFFLNSIVAPVNTSYTERELEHALNISQPKFVFVSPSSAEKTIKVCKNLNYVKNLILIEGTSVDNFTLSLPELVKTHGNNEFDVQKSVNQKVDMYDQTALIFCSSGTTGLPKGVMTTQANMASCLRTYRNAMKFFRALHNVELVALSIAPWFHVLGFVSMYFYASSHTCQYVYLTRFEEKTFFEAIEKYEVNFTILVPPIMVLLAKSPLFNCYDLSSLKDISCGAAPLGKDVEDQVRKRFNGNITIRQGYGLSETTYGIIGSLAINKPGSVGQAIQGVYVKVIDQNGKSLGPHEPGELCFKADRVMKGYINDPTATNETIDKDGWLHSGDIGYYDEDKQFFIVDRLKELIKYKAFQVPPAEIEALLLSNPKVKDCGVIGIPDEDSGELPFAFVVKQPGIELTEKEVADFVAENASKPKWLRGGVKFIDAIPKNPSGKILRRELRQLHHSSKSKL